MNCDLFDKSGTFVCLILEVCNFKVFLCTEYSGVKPKTGNVRLEDIHTQLDAVQ
jgi:hypothetical protein